MGEIEFHTGMREVPQYWPGNCFACSQTNPWGLKLKFWISDQGCFSKCILSENYSGFTGIAHGGIISTLIDEVAAWTVIAKMGKLGFTTDMSVRYFKPVPTDAEIIVQGQILDHEKNDVNVKTSIITSDKILLAEGVCKFRLPEISTLAKLGNIDESLLVKFMDAYK